MTAGKTVLQTKRLAISPCSPADRGEFIALEQDPEVMRFLNGGVAIERRDKPDSVSFLMPEGTEPYVWTARHVESGAFVGWFCLSDEGGNRAELGYRLSRTAWGQGLATEGSSALIDWGLALRATNSSLPAPWPSTKLPAACSRSVVCSTPALTMLPGRIQFPGPSRERCSTRPSAVNG